MRNLLLLGLKLASCDKQMFFEDIEQVEEKLVSISHHLDHKLFPMLSMSHSGSRKGFFVDATVLNLSFGAKLYCMASFPSKTRRD